MTLAADQRVIAADDPPVGAAGPGRGETEPETPHNGVKRFEIGQGPRSYFIFEPEKPKPEGQAPVVVFLHGWFAVNPGFYGAWIDHLVRDGTDRDLSALPERRGYDAPGFSCQRPGGDSRRPRGPS